MRRGSSVCRGRRPPASDSTRKPSQQRHALLCSRGPRVSVSERSPAGMSIVTGWYQCRDCRQTGVVAPTTSMAINGRAVSEVPLLPRCACFVRMHKGKLPAAVTNIMASVPDLPPSVCDFEAQRPAYAPPPSAGAASDLPPRPIFSVDRLPQQRELSVYLGEYAEGSRLGSITVTTEHKLSDVKRLLETELRVSASAQLSRGTDGEKLKVPLHKKQYARPAMPFFPADHHHLLVEERG